MKPGYLTTEFWLALAAQLITLLVLFGVVPETDKDTLQSVIATAIEHSAAVIANAVILWKYIQSRLEVKVTSLNGIRHSH